MPNRIVQQILGCFGLDDYQHARRQAPQARANNVRPAAPLPRVAPAYVAPANRPSYQPGMQYSIAELNRFATTNLPSAANRQIFQSALLDKLLQSDTSRSDKATLCKHLATLMNDEDQLECHGAPRQANYFASYCVDLSLQELDGQYTTALEQNLRHVLRLWVNTLCPVQSEFNINGVIYTRTEVQDILKRPELISRHINQAGNTLEARMEQRLHGVGSINSQQTVHDEAVKDNGGRVLAIMKIKHGQTNPLSNAEALKFVTDAADTHPSKTSILLGANHCLAVTVRDNNWNVGTNPQIVIKEVIQYIQAVRDKTMHANLTNALFERLIEIVNEDPCSAGIMQRLIDVPSGIDPDMNFAGSARQIETDIATLASKTLTRVNELIDEGVEALEAEESDEEVTQSIAGNIGKEMFETRVNQDLKLIQGLPEAELTSHVERLKAGFD